MSQNSVDAGAQNIIVELEEGGQSMIRITDDGCGIPAEQVRLAFERHATSKIYAQEDLEKISTMGFRGEALASIASVSLCALTTKSAPDSVGSRLVIEASKIKSLKEIAFQQGTQIEVRNIFYNTPARRKYLKSAGTEYRHIVDFLTQFALSQPEIGLKLIHNGEETLALTPAAALKDRLLNVFGRDVYDNVLEVSSNASHLKISGFIGKPNIARKSRSKQFLFVNRRSLSDKSVSFAVKEAFDSIVPAGMYPFFVLFIDLAPNFVDVNVHPRKLEVRFLNPKEVFYTVKEACKKVLHENLLAPQIKIDSGTGEINYENPVRAGEKIRFSDFSVPYSRYEKFSTKEALKFTEEFALGRAKAGIEADTPPNDVESPIEEPSMMPIAQIADSYIVAQSENGIVLIDQHAAHERVLYERFMKSFESKVSDSQALLTPVGLDLSFQEALLLKENLAVFGQIGFVLEDFGANSFLIREVPASMVKQDLLKIIADVLDDIQNGKKIKKAQGKKEAVLTSMACRSAIMFGDKLSYDEMLALIKDMDETEQPYTCPHGRPSMFVLSFDELEKKFGRRG